MLSILLLMHGHQRIKNIDFDKEENKNKTDDVNIQLLNKIKTNLE